MTRNADGSIKKLRPVIDPKTLNSVLITPPSSFPRIHDLLEKIPPNQVFTKIDLQDAFRSMQVDAEAEPYLAQEYNRKTYVNLSAPDGVATVPEAFLLVVTQALKGIDNCRFYVDDIIIFAPSFQVLSDITITVIKALTRAKLRINVAKSVFGATEVPLLSFKVNGLGVTNDAAKINEVFKFPRPTRLGGLRTFLGLVNYLARFVPGQAHFTATLHKLVAETQSKSSAKQDTSNAVIK